MRKLTIFIVVALVISQTLFLATASSEAAGLKTVSSYGIGDTVVFGRYEQDNNKLNGSEPIEWIIIDSDIEKFMLISKTALDCLPYNTTDRSVTWETSTIREWLNEDFLNKAFSKTEQRQIIISKLRNKDNEVHGIDGGDDTLDQTFLLSSHEADQLLQNEDVRRAKINPYVEAQGAFDRNGYCVWWLRTPGKDKDMAAEMSEKGEISLSGLKVGFEHYGVRPAMWIDADTLVNGPQPTVAPTTTPQPVYKTSSIEEPKVGTVIYFGKYEQDTDFSNGPELIPWRVLSIENSAILLISEVNLDCKPYHNEGIDVTWNESSIRKWLNNDFLVSVFSSEEQVRILHRTQTNDDNVLLGKGGESTVDRVFLLSEKEAISYFGSDEDRKASSSAYAIAQGSYNDDGYSQWWLRSPGAMQQYASYVSSNGITIAIGDNVEDENNAIRPAIWISSKMNVETKLFDDSILKSLPYLREFNANTLIEWALDKSNKETFDRTKVSYLNEHNKSANWSYYDAVSPSVTGTLLYDAVIFLGIKGEDETNAHPYMDILGKSQTPLDIDRIQVEIGQHVYEIDFANSEDIYAISQIRDLREKYSFNYRRVPMGNIGIDILRDLFKADFGFEIRLYYGTADYIQMVNRKSSKSDYHYVYQSLIRSGYLDEFGEVNASIKSEHLNRMDVNTSLPHVERISDDILTDPSVKVSPTPAPTLDLSKFDTYNIGYIGDEILEIRLRLFELGYFNKKPTQREFTTGMVDYVKEFQKANGLPSDGVLSPKTQAVLFSDVAIPKPKNTTKATQKPTLKYPSVEPVVALITSGRASSGISNGTDWHKLEMKNIGSKKTIDGFTFTYFCMDSNGKKLKQYGYGSVFHDEMISMSIAPGQKKYTPKIYINGFDNAKLVVFNVTRIHYTDGTSVSIPLNFEINVLFGTTVK